MKQLKAQQCAEVADALTTAHTEIQAIKRKYRNLPLVGDGGDIQQVLGMLESYIGYWMHRHNQRIKAP